MSDKKYFREPYRIWIKDELANPKSKYRIWIKLFLKFFELQKYRDIYIRDLKNNPINKTNLIAYTDYLVKLWNIKDFSWKKSELNANWDVHNFTLGVAPNVLIKGVTIKSLKNKNSKKWVILVHGLNSHQYKSFFYGIYFLRAGYNILIYDQRKHLKSTGAFTSLGYFEKFDLEKIYEYLINNFFPEEINFYAWSMGTITVSEFLKRKYSPQITKFVIFDAAITEVAFLWKQIISGLLKISFFDYYYLFRDQIMKRHHYDPEHIKPIEDLSLLKTLPILFIINKQDKIIKPIVTEEYFKIKTYFEPIPNLSEIAYFDSRHCCGIYYFYSQFLQTIEQFLNKIKMMHHE